MSLSIEKNAHWTNGSEQCGDDKMKLNIQKKKWKYQQQGE